ncbi:cation diffusion facilitator family transporter [Edaphobacter aggregans]|uniref:cation diffusion facilitator family transporter n=1 Tax=Edaphobacter aggregans TaxID=570835 RepID=UPI000554407C|nr:cation diffusion facilitator family transporter [Edaphobacter aggregans]
MSYTATPENASQTHAEKRSAALFSVLAALGITVLKFLTGVLTGSLGMLSEAVHSTVDLVAAGITLFSVQVSDRPADDTHNYGHGKVESLSAFVEAVIMLASCVWIVTEAVRRIAFRERLSLEMSVWPFVVLLLSIIVDFTRSKRLHRIAEQHASQALEADAIHFSTDIWSSSAVLLGLWASYAGARWKIPALQLADPIAALVVSGIILYVVWGLGRRTVDALLDATPKESREATRMEMERDLMAIDGVLAVDRMRTRRSGSSYFADLTLGLARNLTFQRTEQITTEATAAVERHLPGADVVVHTVPMAPVAESVHDRIRAVAARQNLTIHDVTVQQFGKELHVEQHLEVRETMPLRQAHELATKLETDIKREIPEVTSILTHIESEPATIEQPESQERDRQLEVRLRRVAVAFPEVLDIHDVMVTRIGAHLKMSCHCTMPDDLSMERVHEVITALEGAFKLDAPEVDRLLIHPEPETDNRR